MQTQTDILIIGAGLSGLAATWQLARSGKDVLLLEARNRSGGRVLTTDDCDLGPSWIWPGQPLVASALRHLNVGYFDQHAAGKSVHQDSTGQVHLLDEPSSMSGSWRIAGGVGQLAREIEKRIEPSRIRFEHRVRSLSLEKSGKDVIVIQCSTPDGEKTIQARKIAIAVPPRLAAGIEYTPALPTAALQKLESTPTWMAGHAKFFARYDAPFWRTKGLCGSATSRRGPLAEIHDASPVSETEFALFGFVGLGPADRVALGRDGITELATAQLVQLFGAEAARPRSTHYQDWSLEKFTAAPTDRVPQTRHPQYGLRLNLGSEWQGKISFTASETALVNGGLIEGAFEAAHAFVAECLETKVSDRPDSTPHTASMGWDWI